MLVPSILTAVLALCACGGGGSAVPSGAGAQPQSVIYAAEGDLFLIKEDSTGFVPLATSGDTERFAYLAGGRVVFDAQPAGASFNASGTFTALIRTVRGARRSRTRATASSPWALRPTGRVLYLVDNVSDHDLYSVNADGTGEVRIISSPISESFAAERVDGRILVRRALGLQADLYSVNADGTGEVALANSSHHQAHRAATASGRVIFLADNPSTNNYDLYAIDPDGTDLVALAPSPDFEEFEAVATDLRPSGILLLSQALINFPTICARSVSRTGQELRSSERRTIPITVCHTHR